MNEVLNNHQTTKGKLLEKARRLAELQHELNNAKTVENSVKDLIEKLLKEEGYASRLDNARKARKEIDQDYKLLKKDIKENVVEYYQKHGDEEPVSGLKIALYDREELVVDEEEAVAWAIENKHVSLLQLRKGKYMDLLKTGVFADQPGEVDDEPQPRVRVYSSDLEALLEEAKSKVDQAEGEEEPEGDVPDMFSEEE